MSLTLSLALFSAAGAEMAIAWAGAAFQDTAASIANPAAVITPLRIDPSSWTPSQHQYFPLLRWLTQALRKTGKIGPFCAFGLLVHKSIVLGANISSSATRRAL